MAVGLAIAAVLAFFIVILLAASARVLREYERAVVFRLGRLTLRRARPDLPDPVVDRMVRVSLRTVTL